jgi:hypothetical protein
MRHSSDVGFEPTACLATCASTASFAFSSSSSCFFSVVIAKRRQAENRKISEENPRRKSDGMERTGRFRVEFVVQLGSLLPVHTNKQSYASLALFSHLVDAPVAMRQAASVSPRATRSARIHTRQRVTKYLWRHATDTSSSACVVSCALRVFSANNENQQNCMRICQNREGSDACAVMPNRRSASSSRAVRSSLRRLRSPSRPWMRQFGHSS